MSAVSSPVVQVVVGRSAVVGNTVTRPADTATYAVGDLIANSTTAGSVVPLAIPVSRSNDATVVLRGIRVKVNDTAWKNSTIRVHLFKDQPTVAVGDNGVLNASETYAFSESNYLGSVDVSLLKQTNDGYAKGSARLTDGTLAEVIDPSTGTINIYGLLETRTAVTPGSGKVFSLVVEVIRD